MSRWVVDGGMVDGWVGGWMGGYVPHQIWTPGLQGWQGRPLLTSGSCSRRHSVGIRVPMTRNWLTPSGRLGSPGTCSQRVGPGEQKVSVLVQKPVGSGLQEGPHCSLSLKAGKDCPCVRAPDQAGGVPSH